MKPVYGGANVFISSSLTDEPLARRLKEDLAKRKLSFLTDETGLRGAEPLSPVIQDAIRKSRYLIVLWSKPAAESLYVRAEMLAALRLKKFVLPCVFGRHGRTGFSERTITMRSAS